LYAHASSVRVSVGEQVARGEVIGGVGNTGKSTGAHLHFEIRNGGANPF
jgi:murein DD-endopeptidase MepM/ murein hydrolase activator NlpD